MKTLRLESNRDGGVFELDQRHVELRIRMRSGLYSEDWRAEGTIWIDAGQLNTLARAARSFDASAGLATTD